MFGRRKILELIDEIDLRIAVMQAEQIRLNDMLENMVGKVKMQEISDKYADYRNENGLLTKKKAKGD
jgi:hypothetical protein